MAPILEHIRYVCDRPAAVEVGAEVDSPAVTVTEVESSLAVVHVETNKGVLVLLLLTSSFPSVPTWI